MKFGFAAEEEWDEPETVNYGVGHMSTTSDSGDDSKSGWFFTNHTYIAIQIGPFAVVIGRPDL